MASETFSCPVCAAALRYSPNLQAGDEVQCPKCKAEFPVPDPDAPPSRASEEVTGEPRPRRPRFSEPESENISSTRRRQGAGREDDEYVDEDFSNRPLTGDYSIDMNRWFNLAGKHYSAFFGPTIGFIIVAYIITAVPSFIINIGASLLALQIEPRNAIQRSIIGEGIGLLPSLVIGICLSFPLFSGITGVSLAQIKGRPWTFGDFFAGFRHWPALAGVALVIYFLSLLVYLPGVLVIVFAVLNQSIPMGLVGGGVLLAGLAVMTFLGVRLFAFAPSIIFDRKLSAVDAIKANWELTRGHFWGLFGVGILLFFIYLGGALACGIGALFAVPYIFLILNAGYLVITDPRETEDYRERYDD